MTVGTAQFWKSRKAYAYYAYFFALNSLFLQGVSLIREKRRRERRKNTYPSVPGPWGWHVICLERPKPTLFTLFSKIAFKNNGLKEKSRTNRRTLIRFSPGAESLASMPGAPSIGRTTSRPTRNRSPNRRRATAGDVLMHAHKNFCASDFKFPLDRYQRSQRLYKTETYWVMH